MPQDNKKIPSIDVDAVSIYDKPNLRGTPERNLVLAILERAILDYVGNNEKEVRRAEAWLFTTNEDYDENQIEDFSFEWVCHQLDLEPKKIAKIIRDMPKRGKSRVAPWYNDDYSAAA